MDTLTRLCTQYKAAASNLALLMETDAPAEEINAALKHCRSLRCQIQSLTPDSATDDSETILTVAHIA